MAITSKHTRKAVAMRFGILSPDQVRDMSAAEVRSEQILDRYRQPQ